MAQGEAQRTQLAGFEIIEKIGQGGMGAVFRARQVTMDRVVAVKILPKKLSADPRYKERFFREARLCARLNHLNIVNAIDCGEADGYTFYAMEYIEGHTVKELLKQKGTFTEAEAEPIARQTAEALRYANAQQLIHRDIKPDNIIIAKDGTAKLLDLGLAKVTGNNEDSSLTQTGQAVGTPHYISPEQARGEQNIDTRTDIYSLGATLYHLFTGKPVFPEGAPASIMAKHLIECAPAVTEQNPEISEDWAAVVCKMMAKDPKDRYADFGEFLADLDAIKNNVVPSALSFRGKSSCAPPPKAKPGKKGAGATTGMRAPIRPNSTTTGPRAAIVGRATTGQQAPVGPRNPTALNSPVGARTHRDGAKQGGSQVALIAGLGVAVLVVLALLAMKSGGDPKPAPKPVVTAQAPVPAPVPPLAVKPPPPPAPAPMPVVEAKTPEPLPQPLPVAQPAPQPEPAPKPPEEKKPEPVVEPAVAPVPAGPDPLLEAAHAKFLATLLDKGRKIELAKLLDEARTLGKHADYAGIKNQVAEELKDLDRAAKLEVEGLTAIGAAKGEIELPKDFAAKFNAQTGKVEKYETGRGLYVKVGQVSMGLNGSSVAPQQVTAAATGKGTPTDAAAFYVARGAFAEARELLPKLPDADRARFAHKLDLLKAGEAEMKAVAAWQNLEQLFNGRKYQPFVDQAGEFEKTHAESEIAKAKSTNLAAMKQQADQILNPNPWPKILRAKENKLHSDGFLELYYDFSTADQAKDFTGEHANPTAENNWLVVPPFGGEFSQAKFIVPVAAIKKLEVVGKTLQQRASRFGIYFVGPQVTDWNSAARLILRPYNSMPHLENWENPVRGNQNLIGSQALDWRRDTAFLAESNGKDFKWTINGAELGSVKLPDAAMGGYLAFAAWEGEHAWGKLRIIFKPEPTWAQQQLDKLKAGKP